MISLWYFARVLGLPGDSPLFGAGMAVFAFILMHRRERLDERDRLINLRAGRNAYVVLFGSIALVLGLIPMIQSWTPFPGRQVPRLPTPC